MMNDFFAPIIADETKKTYKYFDGDTWKESSSGKVMPVISPIDGSLVGTIQCVTPQEIDEMVAKANAAQHHWELLPLNERMRILHKAAKYMREQQNVLTDLLVVEIGKSRDEARKEVVRTADMISYFTREVQSLTGELMESDLFPGFEKGRTAMIERAAHGVVVAIGPFNYPINLTASKIVPALLMGNTVIFKPPTQGSIVGLFMTQLFLQAGIPAGVLCCLTGAGREIGNYLVSHPDIRMVAFTGSSAVGATIAEKTGMIPLLFECGGNNPALVLKSAEMELTATEIVKGGFSYAGQRCTGLKYVLAEESVIAELLPHVIKKMSELVHLGNPKDETTKLVGPVISENSAKEIESVIGEAISQGAELVMGGKRNGLYVEPTILKNVTPSMRVIAEETFGPVVCFVTVNSTEEAITIMNKSPYGLQTSIFTGDEGTAISLSKHILTGTVQINGSGQRGPDHFPFMGVKKSGVGVQGVRFSLEAMSRLKSVVINKPQ